MPSPLLCAKSDAKEARCAQQVPARATRLFYLWAVVFTVGLTCNAYLSCQLRSRVHEQQIQLDALYERVNALDSLVHRLDSSAQQASPQRASSRTKRHTSHVKPVPREDRLRIGRAFRWVETNWTEPVEKLPARQKTRRQVESIPDIGDDNKLPAVDFFSQPQPTDQAKAGFEWVTSYCRISLNVLEQYCFAAEKRCLRGDAGPAGEPGQKGDKGEQGTIGPQGRVGPPGVQGPVGEIGRPGLDGVDGLPGEPGLDGTPGADGRNGQSGVAGQPGTDGTPGRNGTDGKSGQKGEPGIAGTPGIAGPRGKRGAPGLDGKPGVQVQAWKHQNTTLLIAPSIDDMSDKEQVITVKENENVRLICVASGQPKPLITWRRQDKRPIQLDSTTSVNLVEGSHLNISRIVRENMGSYMCVATNGVPPAAQKRVNLLVTFPPLVKVLQPKQMLGTVKGSWVVLECYVEAYPEPFVQWIYDSKILTVSAKYNMSEEVLETRLFATLSRRVLLNISRVESADFGLYKCEAHNQRGRTFGIITLFESDAKTTADESSAAKEHFVVYGEMPKLIESKECEPCPDCGSVSHSFSNQCKEDQRESITNLLQSSTLLNLSSGKLTKRSSECFLRQIGKPVLNGEYELDAVGCWMRDPKPIKPKDEEKYWITTVRNSDLLQEFDSKESFRNKLTTRNYSLVHRFTGNAQIIYAGQFYYAQEGTSKLVIFNLATLESAFVNLEPSVNSLHSSILPKPSRHPRSHRGRRQGSEQRLYSNHLNMIDIASDENGIWLLYPNLHGEANNTVVSKLNGTRIENSWNLTVDYQNMGDTFIMCGVLYGVESLTQLSTHISFAFDLYANKELKHLEQTEFTNPFSATQYIGYNSRHQKLYTWDKGNILEYQLKIETTKDEDDK